MSQRVPVPHNEKCQITDEQVGFFPVVVFSGGSPTVGGNGWTVAPSATAC
ncbi:MULTISPECIES: hypothetical protein [unclassified Streptomyces]|nr:MULTISPECIES: hypothetical protein [unclassified Streptomyces]MDF3142468.1 hypothetical protein [Streptomyces sp. T21Q-yed]WDF39987.1 hypothetical protein PBV52_25960 [Streptomyces sp. T12]